MPDNAAPAREGRCGLFLRHKQRHCRQPIRPGSLYCPAHCATDFSHKAIENSPKSDQNSAASRGSRVPCPADPRHSCFEADLLRHLRSRCPAVRQARLTLALPYFKENCNSGAFSTGNGDNFVDRSASSSSSSSSSATAQGNSNSVNPSCRGLLLDSPAGIVRAAEAAVAAIRLNSSASSAALGQEVSETSGEGEPGVDVGVDAVPLISDVAYEDRIPVDAGPRRVSRLTELTEAELDRLIAALEDAFVKWQGIIEADSGDLPSMPATTLDIGDAYGGVSAPSKLKHVIQERAFVREIRSHGLLNPFSVFCELGAGKGRLTECLISAMRESGPTSTHICNASSHPPRGCDAEYIGSHVLVDRLQGLKNSADVRERGRAAEQRRSGKTLLAEGQRTEGQQASEKTSSNAVAFRSGRGANISELFVSDNPSAQPDERAVLRTSRTRLAMDLKHLWLPAVPHLHKLPSDPSCAGLVFHSKHLCGEATDLALRSLTPILRGRNQKTGIVISDAPLLPFRGLLLATCCHHRCSFSEYLNPDFIKRELPAFATPDTFALLTSMSSWALGQLKDDGSFRGEHSVDCPVARMDSARKCAIGFRAKNMLDIGRVLMFREYGYKAFLTQFVAPDVTPENIMLVVLPSASC